MKVRTHRAAVGWSCASQCSADCCYSPTAPPHCFPYCSPHCSPTCLHADCIFKYNAGPPPYLESTCPLNAPEHPGFPDGPAPSSGIVATGGTVTTSGPVVRHVFTSDGTLEVTTGGTAAHLLLVGGGGGCKGGQEHQGGGGAGGLVYGTDVVLSPGTYTVTVGAGGSSGGSGADTYISGAFSAYVAKGMQELPLPRAAIPSPPPAPARSRGCSAI